MYYMTCNIYNMMDNIYKFLIWMQQLFKTSIWFFNKLNGFIYKKYKSKDSYNREKQ